MDGSRVHSRRLGADSAFIRAVSTTPWARAALVALLIGTGLLYLWGLGASGWANSFYSAAVQAGSESWKAFFFGSSDAANSITVDKTPLALWPMELSVRVFGLSSWSILVPQALEGVATVFLLHRIVRRSTGSEAAALLAGVALALTPVAVLMFRFNNPDAVLVLLLVAASGATLRAIDETDLPTGRPVRWLLVAGSLVGLAFLAKMLQAFLVLPALGLAYLLFARTPIGRRLLHLLAAFAAMVVAGGWWVAIVELWPAGSRPYIGGSQHNSILELTLGYNGLGRLSGDETGSVGGLGRQGGRWGATGIGRLFATDVGGQIAWLIPAALVLGAAALWLGRRNRRLLAATTLWGVMLLVTGLTFSFMAGIFHAYYTVALAPPVAALLGIGTWLLWTRRHHLAPRVVLAVAVTATALLAFAILGRTPDYLPWLRYVVLVAGFVSAALLLGVTWLPRRLVGGSAALAVLTVLTAPGAYSLSTAATAHTGSIPTAGPASAGRLGMPGGGPGRFQAGFRGGFRGMGPGGMNGARPPMGRPTTIQGQGTIGGGGFRGGNAGGLLNGSTPTSELTALLKTDADSYTWVAAAVGSNSASGFQLATHEPVMAIGGFNGSDPSPTLEQFEAYVTAGKIHYFIAGGGMGGGPGGGPGGSSSTSSEIASWVEAHFQGTTVGGVTVYDLSGGAA